VLLGVEQGDDYADAEILASKVANLRIFSDENDKMNLSVLDINGDILVISNFTLCADHKKGNRPSFTGAAAPDSANMLYEYFIAKMQEDIPHVAHGCFGADMQTHMITDGPVTIVMDSSVLKKPTKEVAGK
jgi:D-tyrosyl-tRNA(Tyr) deacylase